MRCFKWMLIGGLVLALSVPASAITLVYEEGPKAGQTWEPIPLGERRTDKDDPLYSGDKQLTFKLSDWTAGTVYPIDASGGTSGNPLDPGFSYDDGVSDLDGLQSSGTRATDSTYGTGGYGNGEEDTWGIARVTRIQDNLNNAVWTPSGKGEELTAIFYGSQDFYLAAPGPGEEESTVNSVGMQVDLYEEPAETPLDWDPSLGPDARTSRTTYPNVTDGTLVLSLSSLPGFLNNPGVDGGLAAEFETQFDFGDILGDGTLFAETRGDGRDDWQFDTNGFNALASAYTAGFPDTHLADFQIQFDSEPTTVGDDPDTLADESWSVSSDDPMKTFSVVPEPVTMAGLMLGVGSLVGYIRRRR